MNVRSSSLDPAHSRSGHHSVTQPIAGTHQASKRFQGITVLRDINAPFVFAEQKFWRRSFPSLVNPEPIGWPSDNQKLERTINTVRQLFNGSATLWYEFAGFQTPLGRTNREDGDRKEFSTRFGGKNRRQRGRGG